MTRDDQAVSVGSPVIKLVTAWLAAIGISSWSEAASAIAFLYTACLLSEWMWKRFARDWLARRGLIERRRRKDDSED